MLLLTHVVRKWTVRRRRSLVNGRFVERIEPRLVLSATAPVAPPVQAPPVTTPATGADSLDYQQMMLMALLNTPMAGSEAATSNSGTTAGPQTVAAPTGTESPLETDSTSSSEDLAVATSSASAGAQSLVISQVNVTYGTGTVNIQGLVTVTGGGNVAGLTIQFGGALSGYMAQTDGTGMFFISIFAPPYGSASATAIDPATSSSSSEFYFYV